MIEKIGIVGGGQLGRMLTEAAKPLGFNVMVVDPNNNSPAAQVGAEQIKAPLTDLDAIASLAKQTDVLTWEIEHIPADFLVDLAYEGVNVEPSPETLLMIQDKLTQKRFLQSIGIPVAPFSEDLTENNLLGGGPYVIKTRRGGYDGRGNFVHDSIDQDVIDDFSEKDKYYIEKKVDFEKELSVIAARDKKGNVIIYPAVETIHRDDICHMVLAPAEVEEKTLQEANDIAMTTLEHLHGAGVFAIEMFVVNGTVMVNEIAPRVHNSGHHTIEANVTSQFEQHIRAVTNMYLGSTAMRSPAVMINILGRHYQSTPITTGIENVLTIPDAHVHFYGKETRPQRKIGHITVLASTIQEARFKAIRARSALAV